jgi:hypothetical protein
MKRTLPHLMLAATFSLICTGVGNATPITAAATAASTDLTLETLMEVELQDQLLLQAALPWYMTDAVAYAYNYDTSTGAFSFSTIMGQSVGGLPFSFSTTAQLDASTGLWAWSGNGVAGSTSFQITGSGAFADVITTVTGANLLVTADGEKKEIKGKYIDDNNNEYDATATVTLDQSEGGAKSSGTGQATDKKGKVVKSGKVIDNYNPLLKTWIINFLEDDSNKPGVKANGLDDLINPPAFQGSFLQTSTPAPTPEPSTPTLFGAGIILIGCGFWSRKRFGGSA